MINLDNYMDKTIDFMFRGELVKVNQATAKMVKKIASLEKYQEGEILDKQIEIVTDILNNNTSGKKFKVSDIENLPQRVINTIMKEFTNSIADTEEDPN